jgi:hypothetical protein
MHVPVPVRITTDAEVDIMRAANDVLALARMNWNTAFDTTGSPITLRFARSWQKWDRERRARRTDSTCSDY